MAVIPVRMLCGPAMAADIDWESMTDKEIAAGIADPDAQAALFADEAPKAGVYQSPDCKAISP